ncbi:MAG: AraC family transcriptional regulator [Bacteroidota bacterium]
MEDYNKIIESLGVRFLKASNIKILQSLTVQNYYDVENTIIVLKNGVIKFGEEEKKVTDGQALFIPGGKAVSINYGNWKGEVVSNEEFAYRKDEFFLLDRDRDEREKVECRISYVTFEAKVFDTVNFFTSLDIPPFVVESSKINSIVKEIIAEKSSDQEGNERVVKLKIEHLAIELIRYVIHKRLFVEQMATNSTYFKDPRLIDIFSYIKENLSGDLSNQVLAKVAGVSEDYVGQYFKMLTGINPQDYIEYQRMEHAVNLLRTTKKSIREIGSECGYKDTAYFCRRFKMMFGIPAGKMRRRESLMNV